MAQTPHVTMVAADGNSYSATNPLFTSATPGTNVTASATGANAALTATLPAATSKTTHITGFSITGAGATAAANITVTVTGTISGTLNYILVIPAGATTSINPLVVNFPRPIPASAANTAIVVNVPAFGLGNLNAAVAAHGYQL